MHTVSNLYFEIPNTPSQLLVVWWIDINSNNRLLATLVSLFRFSRLLVCKHKATQLANSCDLSSPIEVLENGRGDSEYQNQSFNR